MGLVLENRLGTATKLKLTFPNRQDWVLGKILETRARTHSEHPFLQFAEEVPLSFREVNARVNRVAHGLASLGVRQGDKVLIMLPNCLEFLLTWFAVNKLAAVQVPINTAYKGYFLEHVANTSQARVLVTDEDYLDRWQSSGPNIRSLERVVVRGAREITLRPPSLGKLETYAFDDLAYKGDDSDPGIDVQHKDIAAIHFTSGATGPSKGALMTHAHLYFLAETNVNFIGLTTEDVNHTCLPFFHVNAQTIAIYSALLMGSRVVVYPYFSASDWLSQIRASNATITTLLGSMMAFVMKQPPSAEDRDNQLRAVWAVPCPADLASDFRKRFGIDRTVECYGNTEMGIVTMQSSRDSRVGSCGRALTDWYDIKIVDSETDEELPPNTPGELVVRPKVPWIVTQGYVGMSDRTIEAFRNLWFHSGDALKRDEDGYFYFVDRIKDRIRRRGENIASMELEQIIAGHPYVLEVAIVGVKSEHAGGEDEIKVSLVLRPNERLRYEDFTRWCEERMPYFAVPRFVEFLPSLPKTPTNKLMKGELRQRGLGEHTWDREAAGYKLKEQREREQRKKNIRS